MEMSKPEITPAQARSLLRLISDARTVTDPDGQQFGRMISDELEDCSATLQLIANGPDLPCDRPPTGWTCSRPRNHSGPCAASPIEVPDEQ
jgi:hypothetical protein